MKMKSLKKFLQGGKNRNNEPTQEEMEFYINDYVSNAQAKEKNLIEAETKIRESSQASSRRS